MIRLDQAVPAFVFVTDMKQTGLLPAPCSKSTSGLTRLN